jgi:hypothetical protein
MALTYLLYEGTFCGRREGDRRPPDAPVGTEHRQGNRC